MKTELPIRTGPRRLLLRSFSLAAISLLLATARGQTPAETLEKGIYTEETRGDLPGAIALYEQALAEAKSNEPFAAQALLRLALCHRKLNHEEEAIGLLRKLIQDYPEQEELVAQARKLLPGDLTLGPVPWRDGESMILHFRTPAGANIGMTAYYARQVHENGSPAWLVGQRTFAGRHAYSSVLADPETFLPIQSTWSHQLLGNASATFTVGSAQAKLPDGSSRRVELDGPVFDNEQAVHFMRRLPLKLGYQTTFSILSTLGGGVVMPITIKVTQEDKTKVPAGEFNTLKVELLPVYQSFWFSNDENRYLVRMDAGGVIGELVEVQHLQPGQPNLFTEEELGFTVNLPVDWYAFKGPPTEEKDRVRVALLDDTGRAHCMIMAYPRKSLKPEISSLKDWAEDRAAYGAQRAADFKVDPESWADSTVAGYPALSFTADYTEGDKQAPMKHYSLVVMTPEIAAHFFIAVEAGLFESTKKELDQIISSLLVR